MIKIKKLIVDGFWLLSNSEIDFTNKEGLINLVGRNLDGFSSNGAGKSTIPNALTQSLYGKNMIGKPNKEIYNKSSIYIIWIFNSIHVFLIDVTFL